jgi:TP901 family phage tail tape measure protein
MARLIKPTKMAQEQMEALGFSFDDIKDKKFNDQMKKIAQGLQQVGSETERNRILMNLFDVETAGAAGTLIRGFLEGKEVVSEMAEQVGQCHHSNEDCR